MWSKKSPSKLERKSPSKLEKKKVDIIDVSCARDIAQQHNWVEITCDEKTAVICFETPTGDRRGKARINFYYKTGTVNTILPHPRLFTTQLFTTITSESQLNAILKEPRRHPDVGYRFRESKAKTVQVTVTGEKAALLSQLAKLESEAKDIAKERTQLQLRLHKYTNQNKPLVVTKKKQQCALKQAENVWYSLRPNTAKSFSRTWKASSLSVSLGKGYCTVQSDGSYSCSQVPQYLFNKLRSTRQPLAYVSMGSLDRYYVRFRDGEWQGIASDSCIAEIEAANCGVHKISFGAEWGSYFILFQDGSTVWHDLPLSLHNKLNGRQASLPVVEELSISPSEGAEKKTKGGDEPDQPWFVRFTDGSWEARGLPDELDSTIKIIPQNGADVTNIIFGLGGTWIVQHAPGAKVSSASTSPSKLVNPAKTPEASPAKTPEATETKAEA